MQFFMKDFSSSFQLDMIRIISTLGALWKNRNRRGVSIAGELEKTSARVCIECVYAYCNSRPLTRRKLVNRLLHDWKTHLSIKHPKVMEKSEVKDMAMFKDRNLNCI